MKRGDDFITNRDIFGMRSKGFAGNWAMGCFLFARSLGTKECDVLCSFAMHLSPQFSDSEVRSRLEKRFALGERIDEEDFVRSLFEYTFNKDVGVQETLRPDKVPVAEIVLHKFRGDIDYLLNLGRKNKIHS